MTVHPAVHRNHDTAAFHRFGADIGSDVPVTLEVVDSLHPLLDKFGNTDLKLVVFTIDETLYFTRNRSLVRVVSQPLYRCALVVHRRTRVGDEVQTRRY